MSTVMSLQLTNSRTRNICFNNLISLGTCWTTMSKGKPGIHGRGSDGDNGIPGVDGNPGENGVDGIPGRDEDDGRNWS